LKRWSPLALFVGAFPGAAPTLIGWASVTNSLDPPALILFFILYLWQIPHFLAIDLTQRTEFERAGIRTLSVERGEKAAKHCLVRYLTGLVAVSLYPLFLGIAETPYLWSALILGFTFLGWGLYGLRPEAGSRWARGFFRASLAYLPLIFVALCLYSQI